MIERLVNEINEKYDALNRELADPAIFDDQARYAEVSKAHSDLGDAYRLAQEYADARQRSRPRRRPCSTRAGSIRR